MCIFKIPPHIFKLKQKLEDKYSLSIDSYKFSALKAEEAKGNLKNWAYLNVIAQIQQNNVLEYVAYNGVKIIRPKPSGEKKDNSGKTSTTLFFTVAGILFFVVVALFVIIIIFQQRNKNLLNQVKHVSFQQTNSNNNVDPNLLLQKSQQENQ